MRLRKQDARFLIISLANVHRFFSLSDSRRNFFYMNCCQTTLCLKTFSPLNSLLLCEILTDFLNFCTAGKRKKFANLSFVANFVRFPAKQKNLKSVKIWESYREFEGGNFFEITVYTGTVLNCNWQFVILNMSCSVQFSWGVGFARIWREISYARSAIAQPLLPQFMLLLFRILL